MMRFLCTTLASLSICAGTLSLLAQSGPESVQSDEVVKPFPVIVTSARLVADNYFYLETTATSRQARLMVRKLSGTSARMLLDPATLVTPGEPAVIIDIEPSPNGRYVAAGVSFNKLTGSTIYIVDTATGSLLKDRAIRSVDGSASWSDDSRSFYYRQFQDLPAGSAPAQRYENMRAYLHTIGDTANSDRPVFGTDIAPELNLPARGAINAFPMPGTSLILAVQSSSPQELDSFWVRDLASSHPSWRQIIDHKDEVLFEFASHGKMLYFITRSGEDKLARDGRLLAFNAATEDISKARVMLPASDLVLSNRDEDGVVAAQDALYVYGRLHNNSVVLRVPYDDPLKQEEIKLPTYGVISDMNADDRVPGFIYSFSIGEKPPTTYLYDPKKKQSIDTHLQPHKP